MKLRKLTALLVAFTMLLGMLPVMAAEAAPWKTIYVSPQGSDDGSGTEASPFRTLSRAQEAVREINSDMQGDIVVQVAKGTYYMDEPLSFRKEDSGTNGHRVIWRGIDRPTISGGKEITGFAPSAEHPGLYEANVDGIDRIMQIYVNGKKRWMIAYSRSDVNSASERMGWLYQIAESEDFSDGVTIGQKNSPGTAGQGYEVSLKKPVTGRYVRVACKEYFVIAEIEVFGTLAPEKAKGEYDDIESEGTIYNASQLAYALGIMEGTTATEFGVGYLMTRAEAAEAAARLQGSGELDWAETGYSDVPYEHDKSGYIAWCEKAGIVSKGAAFRPDDFITGTEFVTMLLRLNGWYCLAQDGQYPLNVINAAQKTKLTKGVDIDLSAKLNKSRAILLIYNMLTSQIALPTSVNEYGVAHTAGDTYIEEVLGLSFNEGVIEAVEYTDLVEPVGTGSSIVTIDSLSYNDISGISSAYLGERVYFLSDERDNVTYMWRNPEIGTRMMVMCEDIIKSDSSSLTYYDETSDKERKLSLESPIYFIKNGAASGDFRLNNLKRTNGKLVHIDNDGNGRIDVIKLYEPKVIVVDYVGVDGKRLSIGAQNGDTLEVPSFSELIITKNGFVMPYSEIPSGSLVYAYVSDDKKHVELEVSLESVTGEVEAITDDEVTLDGETYRFSDYYTVNTAIIDDIRVGAEVSFLLDERGLIVWAVNDNVTASTETLAVILAVSEAKGFEALQIRLFNEKNEMVTLTCANKVKVDGINMGMSKISALGQDYFKGKAAIYKLNSNGLVTYLNTENYNSGAEKPDKLMVQDKWSLPSGSGRAAMGFYSGTKMVLPVYKDFPVFTIAKDSSTGDIVIDEDFKNRFSYKGINSLYPTSSDTESSGTFTFYGDADDDSPAFAVRFINVNTETSIGTMSAYTSNSTVIVDHVAQYQTSTGDSTYRIHGYNASTGMGVKLVVAPNLTKVVESYEVYIKKQKGESTSGISFTGLNYISSTSSTGINNYTASVSELKQGDILRYELTNNQVTALERIYCVSDTLATEYVGHILNTGDNYGKQYRAGYRAFCGSIERADNGIVEIETGGSIEGFNYKTSSVKNVIIVEDDEIKAYDVSLLPMYVASGDRVFVVTLSGKASYMIVYK